MRTLRVTKPLLHGPDVLALQGRLARHGFFRGARDGIYGTETAQAVYRAKLLLGYQKPDHAAGGRLSAYLTGTRKPSDAMGRRALERRRVKTNVKAGTTSGATGAAASAAAAKKALAATDARAGAVMQLLLANEPRVHYRQARPMATRGIDTLGGLAHAISQGGGISLDCSESATLIARLSGDHDPNGNDYNGTGYTGTILDTCTPITKSALEVGDLIVLGPGTGHHVVTVLKPGPDPLVFSHGQERGPIAIRLSEEDRWQPAPTRYLRIPR